MEAHKLIANTKKIISGALQAEDMKHIDYLNNLIVDIETSIKFDFGDISFLPKTLQGITEVPSIPYDIIYCEFTSEEEDMRIGVLIKKTNKGLSGSFFQNVQHLFIPADGAFSISRNEGIKFFDMNGNACHDEALSIWNQITFNFISIMNCSNVELITKTPSRMKKALSKLSLFEYKTLHIKVDSKRNLKKGNGSHNSPRVHLRRGHIRTLASGAKTWVQCCMVGGKSKGVIHKEYKLTA